MKSNPSIKCSVLGVHLLFLGRVYGDLKFLLKLLLFGWTAVLGKILTIDNLRRCNIIIVDWCCTCKQNEESVDHLLLHCGMVGELWSLVLCLFGLQWAIPKRVVNLLGSWKGRFAKHQNGNIWNAIPLCIMWILSKERNSRMFNGLERLLVELKLIFLYTLYDWMAALTSHSFSSFLGFLDCSKFT